MKLPPCLTRRLLCATCDKTALDRKVLHLCRCFREVNKCLSFDREKSYGYHLDIPSGTSVRFEPGEEKEVQLTEMGGRQRVFGLNDLTCARAADDTKAASMENAKRKGFL